jgi:hypothetical protein
MVIGHRRAIAGQQRPCSITSPRTQRCATDGGRNARSKAPTTFIRCGRLDAVKLRKHRTCHPRRTRALLFPRKFYRQKWSPPAAAFALAIAIAFVRELQTATLRIILKATSQPPSTVGTAFGPAGAGGPDRLGPFAARERQFLIVRVVAPGRRLSFGGYDWHSSHQNADKQVY